MQWVTVLVLFLILKKFFFEKVQNFIVSREHAIQDAYDNADITNRKADEVLSAYKRKIADIEAESREIIKKAKDKADKQAGDIIDEANRKADDILAKAKSEIERERAQAILGMKGDIITYAVMAAEKIVEKELETDGQEFMLDKIIEQAGKTGWRN